MTTAQNLRPNDPQKARDFFNAKMTFTTGPAELNDLLEQSAKLTVVDVREKKDYERGHVPGAINLPMSDWRSFKGLSRDRQNIVYCYTAVCHLAAKAAALFASEGFPVIEMDGGFEAWKEYGYPTEKATDSWSGATAAST